MNDRDQVFEQLAQDARRLRVARKLPNDGPVPIDQAMQVRDDLKAHIAAHSLTLAKCAKMLGPGFSQATLSSFLGHRPDFEFVGDLDRIARGINQWLETQARSREVARPDGWVETLVATRMLNLIRRTIETNTIGLIYCDAGRGKTMTLEAATQIWSNAISVRVWVTTAAPGNLCRQIMAAERVAAPKRSRSLFDAQMHLIERLRGSGRPLFIDEAQRLSIPALEFLRDVHDEAQIPLVLAGTVDLNTKVTDQSEFYGQFDSRVAMRYDVIHDLLNDDGSGSSKSKPLHSVDEIRRLWESDKVRLADDALILLAKIANLPGLGALRLVRDVVMIAQSICKNGVITVNDVMKVMSSRHTPTWVRTALQHALESTKVKVA